MSTIKLAKNQWLEAGVKAGWANQVSLEFYKSASKQNCIPSQQTLVKMAGIWDMWSKGKSRFDKGTIGLESYFLKLYKNLATLVNTLQKGGEDVKNFMENTIGLRFPIDIQGSITELSTMMADLQNTIDYIKNNKGNIKHSNLPYLTDASFNYLITHLENSPKIDESTIDNVINDLSAKFDLTDKQITDLAELKKHKVHKFLNPDMPTFYENKYKNVA
jgi:hypothetical protein